jgi:Ion channel
MISLAHVPATRELNLNAGIKDSQKTSTDTKLFDMGKGIAEVMENKRKLIDKYIRDPCLTLPSATVSEEDYKFQANDMYMLNPDHSLYLIWKIFIGAGIIYIQMVTAYRMAFSVIDPNFDEGTLIAIISLYCIVIFDHLLILNTKYYEKGRIVTQRKAVMIHALKNWYLLTLIPFSGMFYRLVNGLSIKHDQVLVQNILDILFIFKTFDVFDTIDKFGVNFKFSRKLIGLIYLINLLVKLIFLVHWTTCLWLYMLQATEHDQRVRFLEYFNLQGKSSIDIYVANLYWFMTTVSTVGFGDFFPVNELERLYLTAIMIFSALFFGYLVNAVGKFMIQNQTQEISIKLMLAGINQEFKDK